MIPHSGILEKLIPDSYLKSKKLIIPEFEKLILDSYVKSKKLTIPEYFFKI